jgi:tetratricopeptide (TPR) repeat protein
VSSHIPTCSECGRDRVYDRHVPFPEDQETTYGVSWGCPEGHGLMLDICPLGPLVPTGDCCLNCGASYNSKEVGAICTVCGLSKPDCSLSLGLEIQPPDSPIDFARSAFAQGLFRRGLAAVNLQLQSNPTLLAGWFLKSRFMHSLRFHRSAAEMLDGALSLVTAAADRIELLEEQCFMWAECNRGEDALRSIDAAVVLGSKSVRTHFLRGRALGLVGRLPEAREEMNRVLQLDPINTDALRGLGMINAAIGPSIRKPWWKVW